MLILAKDEVTKKKRCGSVTISLIEFSQIEDRCLEISTDLPVNICTLNTGVNLK